MADDECAWTLCADWTIASTMEDALKAARAREEGKWKWNKPSGNCKTNAQLRCNAHLNCDRVVRIIQIKGQEDGKFHLHEKGKHGEEAATRKRKDSPLTYAEEEAVALCADMGGRPGKAHVAFTLKEIKKLTDSGMSLEEAKLDKGGLRGVACPSHAPHTCDTRILA